MIYVNRFGLKRDTEAKVKIKYTIHDHALEGIVKMHEEIIDRQKELRTEQMYLHSVLHAYLITLKDGERFKIRNTYFNRDTKKQVGGTIRYVGGK